MDKKQPGKTVLVVDDEEILRYLAKRQLKMLGFECDSASDGREAVKMMGENPYALVLMDTQMPVMDGIEATREIRQLEKIANVQHYTPIVALTAMADRQECMDAGMNDHVLKPVNIHDLRKMIERWTS